MAASARFLHLLSLLPLLLGVARPELLVPAVPFAHLGLGYNLRTGQIGAPVLADNMVDERRSITSATTDYRLVTSTKEALDLLSVGGSLSVAVTTGGGDVTLSGEGSYLSQEGDRRDYAEMLFTSFVRNHEYTVVDPKDSGRADCDTMDKEDRGTHVITGIVTGGRCIISVKYWAMSSSVKKEIEAKARLEMTIKSVSLSGAGNYSSLDSALKQKLNVTINTFCTSVFDTSATDANEAAAMAERFLELHADQNPNGIPLFMRLTPVSDIESCKVAPETIKQTSAQFEEAVVERLQDIKVGYEQLTSCLNKFPLSEKTEHTSVVSEAISLKSNLRKVLITLAKVLENIDQYVGNAKDLLELEGSYKTDHSNLVTLKTSIWKDEAIVQCSNLMRAWAEEQPKPSEPPTPTPPTGFPDRYNCEVTREIGRAFVNREKVEGRQKRSTDYSEEKCITLDTTTPIVAFTISSYRRDYDFLKIRSSGQDKDNGLLGTKIYIGPPDVREYNVKEHFSYENLLLLRTYPNEDDVAKLGSLLKEYKQGSASYLSSKHKKFFQGQVLQLNLNYTEPIGVVVVQNTNSHPIIICDVVCFTQHCKLASTS